jgi:hypothetical protein
VLNSRSEQFRKCFLQAAECAQEADVQTDPKVKQQFLVLTRLWLIMADHLDLKPRQGPAVKREAEEDWGR